MKAYTPYEIFTLVNRIEDISALNFLEKLVVDNYKKYTDETFLIIMSRIADKEEKITKKK